MSASVATSLGPSMLVVGYGTFESPVLLRSPAQLGPPLFATFAGHLGLLLSLQQALRTGPVMAVGPFLGKLESMTPVVDLLRLGSAPFARSFSKFDFSPFALDFNTFFGLTLSPRSFTYLGSSSLILGHNRSEALLLTVDLNHLDSFPSARSSAHFETFLLVPNFSQPEPALPLHRFTGLEPTLSIPGSSCTDASPLVWNHGFPGASPLLRSFGWLDLPFLTSDTTHPDFSMSVRNSIHLDFGLSPCGECQFFQVSVREFLTLDLSLLLRALSQLGSLLPVFSSTHTDPSPLLHGMLRLGFLLLTMGHCGAGPTLSISGSDLLDLLLLLHGTAQLASSPFVFDSSHFDMLLLLQRSSCSGFLVSLPSFSWSGSLLLTFGMGHLGAGLLPRAFASLDVFMSIWDFCHFDPTIFVQSAAQIESSALALRVRLGSVLLVFDPLHLDSPAFVQSPARLGASLPALCWSRFEPTLLLRGPS